MLKIEYISVFMMIQCSMDWFNASSSFNFLKIETSDRKDFLFKWTNINTLLSNEFFKSQGRKPYDEKGISCNNKSGGCGLDNILSTVLSYISCLFASLL